MEDLKRIKKFYGEKMSHLCRELFPSILEYDGALLEIFEKRFEHSKDLYDDIINNNLVLEFKDYIYSLFNINTITIDSNDTPEKLLDIAGYNFYKINTIEELLSYKRYFEISEEICSFDHPEERLDRAYVFFAVKKDVENIKREDFDNPKREDEYGTSVISIQFLKGKNNTLKITNRYNHAVNNPDCTYGNNLENIMPGLTKSFEREYNLNICQTDILEFKIPGYIQANDGKFYKYNLHIGNVYYCNNNIIIEGLKPIKNYDTNTYLLMDCYILDIKNKTIKLYYDTGIPDTFIDTLKGFNKVYINNVNDVKQLIFVYDDNKKIVVELDKNNQIISYINPYIKKIDSNFLDQNISLNKLYLPEVKIIDDYFLFNNKSIEELNLPNVEEIGYGFLTNNEIIKQVNLENVKKIDSNFLASAEMLEYLNLPNLEKMGVLSLNYGKNAKEVNLNKDIKDLNTLQEIDFLFKNERGR